MTIDPQKLALLLDNQADRAVSLTASSAAASLPVSNLLDHQRTTIWRSATGGDQSLDVTLPLYEQAVDVVGLVDHNLTLEGSVRIQAWTDAIDGAALVLDLTHQPYQPVRLCGEGLCGEGLCGGFDPFAHDLGWADGRAYLQPTLLVFLVAPVAAAYWRITLSNPGLAYHQAGRLWLGPVVQPDHNYALGWRQGLAGGQERILTSRGGQRYANPRRRPTVLRLPLDYMTSADRDRLWIAMQRFGDHAPLLACLRPAGGWAQEASTYYCYLSPGEIGQSNGVFAQADLILEEAL